MQRTSGIKVKNKGECRFVHGKMINVGFYVLAILMITVPVSPDTRAVNPLVKFFEGRLSIRAVEVPLEDLVREIRKKSGIVIDLRDAKAAEKPITVDFVNRSPALALEEILRGLNFASWYENGRLSQLVVLSPGDPPSPQLVQSKPPPPRPQPTTRPSVPRPDLEALLKRDWNEGMKAIAQTLKGNNRRDKFAAVDALGSVEHPEALKLLSTALADSDRVVKKIALEALADKEGPDVIPLLGAGLQDSDPSIREDVLEALSKKGELQLVRGALSDPDRDVREKAQELLETERKASEAAQRKTARPDLQRR